MNKSCALIYSINQSINQSHNHTQTMEQISRVFPPCGLSNLGSTCFMNAAYQALLADRTFSGMLFTVWNEVAATNGGTCGFPVLDAFAALIAASYSGAQGTDVTGPLRVLMSHMGTVKPAYARHTPEDAFEYLRDFLDALPCRAMVKEFTFGSTVSAVVCGHCFHASTTAHDFRELQVFPAAIGAPVPLDACVREYFEPERVPGWTCERCRRDTGGIKSIRMHVPPRMLVVYIQRQPAAVVDVDVPPVLDLTRWCVTLPSAPVTYSLSAIVNHHGGHYTACVRRDAAWFWTDDAVVRDVSAGTLGALAACRPFAYIALYSRQSGL